MEEVEIKYHTPILLSNLGRRLPRLDSKQKRSFSLFKCFCGNEFEAQTYDIEKGRQKSCGCLNGEITHGLSNHRLYKTWQGMLHRCYNPKIKDYKYYGGRGITVCDRWHSIENFIEDMFSTFEEGLTLDRIDVDGNYNLDNCRWVTKNVQASNTKLLSVNNTSGFRGVQRFKGRDKWFAKIKVNNKNIHLGSFNTAEEGAIAYNNYVIENNLEYPLNIIPSKICGIFK